MAALARRPAALAALLFALVLALYWRTRAFEFLNYDDDVYVTANEGVRGGLSLSSVRWAFASTHAANWHPLTWLSHQLDVELFGLDPGAHHRTSALLHALAAALLFLALTALTGARGKSALAAALFALHPLRVESVAWVAERKDLLAACCAFGCLWAYALYARSGCAGRYALSLALFALGLLAKPMVVTLPCVLLLLDVWPLGRTTHPRASSASSSEPARPVERRRPRRRLVLEKLPFLALSAASSYVTLRVQRAGGAFETLDAVGLGARIANAIEAYGWTLAKTLWPSGLCVFHPHPSLAVPPRAAWTPTVLLALGALLAVTLAVVLLRRRAPHALVGWLWFLGMLVPVSGILQVGLQAWAERYAYLPSVGLALALVWGADALAWTKRARAAWLALAGLALLGLALASWRQIGVWRDSRTLFEHALSVAESDVAHVNLGRALEEAGDLAGAERHYARARELRPSLAGARVNLARVFRRQGRLAEAVAELEEALAREPDLAPARAELGWLLTELGRDAEALPHLRRAVELEPSDLALQNNLAWVLATSRTCAAPAEAHALAQRLVRDTRGAQPGFLETLAAALARLGRFEEATQVQARALERVPPQHRAPLEQRLALYRAGQAFVRSP
jgi:tetratricopeptide (TPR) repeat protein